MQILVFAAKWIGAKCIEDMLDAFPDDSYSFVACDPDATLVENVLQTRGHKSVRLNKATLDDLRETPKWHFDWLCNLWGGYIFKLDILSRARRTLNIHPAFLPYGRGRDPVVWAIRHEFPAGLTLHEITEGVDEGPILYREEVPFEFPEKGGILYDRVVERCWRAFVEQWPSIRDGKVPGVTQVPIAGTKTYRRSALLPDRRIDLDNERSARETILRLLAHDFSPGYTAQILINGKLYNTTLNLSPVKLEETA